MNTQLLGMQSGSEGAEYLHHPAPPRGTAGRTDAQWPDTQQRTEQQHRVGPTDDDDAEQRANGRAKRTDDTAWLVFGTRRREQAALPPRNRLPSERPPCTD
ncbi:hypothetical protein CDD83_1301 [Cordyceps sp. RAO-2017]|nr:hypothetical protein CDD83_1301 [Cordyceps sp. RAO-2017]